MSNKGVVIVGGGAAGLAAAHTLKKRGIKAVLLEADGKVGGRLAGDRFDGFSIDTGADFFCSTYDTAYRICEELNLPLIRSLMTLGWFRNGEWAKTIPMTSIDTGLRTFPGLRKLGLISPKSILPMIKLANGIRRQSEFLSFSSDSRLTELDGDETFGDYLDRLGIPEDVRVMFRGFLELTMGHVELSGAAYMRTYLAEMLLKANQIYVPKFGAGALAAALGDACADVVRVSTPVKRVVIEDGTATGVITDSGMIEADAVICAVPGTKVSGIVPDLSGEVHRLLSRVIYSTGCRVVIGLDRPPLPMGWTGVMYPEDDTPALLCRTVNLPACVPQGMFTLDMLVGRERAEELLPLEDGEIIRALLRDARRNPPPGSDLPADGEGVFTRVYRWKEAVCMGPPGMFAAVADARRKVGGSIGNLFLAGDYTRVPSVNGALASGVGAADEAAELLEAASAKPEAVHGILSAAA